MFHCGIIGTLPSTMATQLIGKNLRYFGNKINIWWIDLSREEKGSQWVLQVQKIHIIGTLWDSDGKLVNIKNAVKNTTHINNTKG